MFGSVARGDFSDLSDIDFLVDLEPGRSLFDLGGLLMDLQDLLGLKVDIGTTRFMAQFFPLEQTAFCQACSLYAA